MKAAALSITGLLFMGPVERPPVEYQGKDPITVQVTYAHPDWVNAECAKRVGRQPPPGMVFAGCAAIGGPWAIKPHGCLYAGGYAALGCHEVAHIRGWRH